MHIHFSINVQKFELLFLVATHVTRILYRVVLVHNYVEPTLYTKIYNLIRKVASITQIHYIKITY